jgi:hypothetical protein
MSGPCASQTKPRGSSHNRGSQPSAHPVWPVYQYDDEEITVHALNVIKASELSAPEVDE